MTTKRFRFATILTAAALIAAACSPATPIAVPTAGAGTIAATVTAPTATAAPTTAATIAPLAHKLCQVTDLAGVNDQAANALTWTAVQAAAQALGWQAAVAESKLTADLQSNLDGDVVGGQCGLVVTVGSAIGPVTQATAAAHPGQKFLILNFAYKPDLPNVWHQTYAPEQGAFLAGYLAAAMS